MPPLSIRYIGVTLRDWTKHNEEKVTIEKPISVKDVLDKLEKIHGKMPLRPSSLLIIVDGKSAKLETILHGNETVVFAPLIGGG